MAKKKSTELTLEEKLEQALVPVEEQPYEVPENWCWTRLDFVARYKKGPFGAAITKAMFVPKSENTFKVYEQGNAIRKTTEYGNYYISEQKYTELISFAVEPGDLIVSCAGTIGETYQLPDNIEAGIINQALMRVRVSEKICLKYYLYYFDEILRQDITGKAKGSAIKNIPPFAVLKNMQIPLPPLAEQQRIVDRIESLFAKLDEAKSMVLDVLDGANDRRAAIQHQAFYGELTTQWRKEKGIEKADWGEETLQDVCVMKITDGTHQTPTYCDKDVGVPFISAKDVTSGMIDWSGVKYIIPELHEELYKRISPQKGDVLLAKNGTTGVAALVVDDKIFDIYVTLAVLRPDVKQVYPKYLYYVVNSIVCKTQFDAHLTGIGVPNLHLRDIKEVKIPVPSLDEQKAIIGILDEFYNKEDMVYAVAEDTLEKIEYMKKSILAKVFRGELGTNDSLEESSIELLKKIL